MDFSEVRLLFEFLDLDLINYIDKSSENGINPEIIKSIIYQLLCGLNYLHVNRIIHRDIKPQVFNYWINVINDRMSSLAMILA